MADNLSSPVPNGTILAADDIGGVLYPRTKIAHGVDGAAVDASATNPLPVSVSGVATQVTLASILAKVIAAPATEAKQDATVTSIGQSNTKLDSIVTALTTPSTYLPPEPLGVVADTVGLALDFNSVADQAVISAKADTKVRVYRARIYVSAATTITIYDGTSTGAVVEIIQFPSAGGIILDFDTRPYWVSTTANTLTLKSSAAVRVTGRLTFTQVA